MTYTASLGSELRKIKRTTVPYLTLISGIIVPCFVIFDHLDPEPGKQSVHAWEKYFMEARMAFVFVVLPLFTVLASTLLMQIEVRNNTWKQVLASPQSHLHILLGKFTVLQLMLLAVVIIHEVTLLLGAVVLDVLPTDANFLEYFHRWPDALRTDLFTFTSTFGLGALSFWLALRFKNFIVPIAIGFSLWFLAPTLAFGFDWAHADKYVFAIPFTIVSSRLRGQELFYAALSLGYCVIFLAIAYAGFVPWPSLKRFTENKTK